MPWSSRLDNGRPHCGLPRSDQGWGGESSRAPGPLLTLKTLEHLYLPRDPADGPQHGRGGLRVLDTQAILPPVDTGLTVPAGPMWSPPCAHHCLPRRWPPTCSGAPSCPTKQEGGREEGDGQDLVRVGGVMSAFLVCRAGRILGCFPKTLYPLVGHLPIVAAHRKYPPLATRPPALPPWKLLAHEGRRGGT